MSRNYFEMICEPVSLNSLDSTRLNVIDVFRNHHSTKYYVKYHKYVFKIPSKPHLESPLTIAGTCQDTGLVPSQDREILLLACTTTCSWAGTTTGGENSTYARPFLELHPEVRLVTITKTKVRWTIIVTSLFYIAPSDN